MRMKDKVDERSIICLRCFSQHYRAGEYRSGGIVLPFSDRSRSDLGLQLQPGRL